jgi:hypothetical protein
MITIRVVVVTTSGPTIFDKILVLLPLVMVVILTRGGIGLRWPF